MNKGNSVSKEMLKAYEEAIFSFSTEHSVISFKVGSISNEIIAFMNKKDLNSAALITAFNPYSQVSSKDENQSAQTRLIEELRVSKIDFIYGEGRDALGIWDPEPSLLALNISMNDAEKLATKFMQNAFVWIEASSGIPTLKLMFPVAS